MSPCDATSPPAPTGAGGDLTYDDLGAGPPVLLLHGFPLCRRMWRPQAQALPAAGYRLILPDLRGFGESAGGEGPLSMSLFADDVVALMDQLGLDRAVIGGMSMGGYVLLDLLDRYPDRLAGAMFLVTRAGGEDAAGWARRTALAEEVLAGHPEVVTDAFEKVLFAEATLRRRPELVAEVGDWMRSTPTAALAGGLFAMRDRKDYLDRLPDFDLPALVLVAEEDRAVPPAQGELLVKGLPQGRLCRVAEAGHMANLEQPEAFSRCLLDFLATLT